jgi:hypothetical protein
MQHSAETYALSLVMIEDIGEATRVVDSMTVREKADLITAIDSLRDLMTDQFGNVIDTDPLGVKST